MNRDDAACRIRQALVADLDEILRTLAGSSLSDEAVHSVRKSIKKARAALRLLRESVGEDIYRQENVTLRDAGRCFSALRDAKSLADAFEDLRRRQPDEMQQPAYDALSRHLHEKLIAGHRSLLRAPASVKRCKKSLADCRDRAAAWKDDILQNDDIPTGLRRIFRSGRKALDSAKDVATPEALHEWRKKVKYLSNALKLLDVANTRLEKVEKRTAKLADALGDDHDLSALAHFLEKQKSPIDAGAQNVLMSLIARRSDKLQTRAYAMGAEIYDQKPGHFVRRLDTRKKTKKTDLP
jgi:hypothetical protein